MMPKQLLIVEDDKKIATLVCKVAEEAGFTAHIADGENFAEYYNKIKPDVIILDVFMPGVDGFEIIQFLGDEKSQAHIVILSGNDSYRAMAENFANALGLQIDINVAKPFRVKALRMCLQEIKLSLSRSDKDPLTEDVQNNFDNTELISVK